MYSTMQSKPARATPCRPDGGDVTCVRNVLGVNVSLLVSVSLNRKAWLVSAT